ncbi:MAG: PAS domain S-box protein, partial [Deltaproteobacteria bacterium]
MSGSSTDWKQILELASEGFWLLDKKFMTVYVNPSLQEMLGYSEEEMIGRSWYDFGDPEWVVRAKELENRREQGIKESHKFLFIHKDGRQVLTRIATTPLYDNEGNFDGAIGVLSDISNEKETEDALKSKDMLSSITKAASVGMSLINRDYTIEWYNDLHAQWFGSLEKAKGRNCYELFEGRDTICPDCPVRVSFETGDEAFVEHVGNPELLGAGRIFSLTTSPVRDANNNVIQVVEIAQDITERKRSEAVLLARLRLQKFAVSHSLDELLRATLDEAEALTGSRIGFYHFVDPDQLNITLQAWSTNTAQICKAEGSGSHYPVEQAGVWVDCLRERRAVIHNDYASLPHRKGLPEGHTQVMRELVVPVLRDDAIVAILGVGNKPIDYRERDIETITSLADFAWDIVQSKQAEEKLRESEEKYRAIVDSIDGDMYICAKDYRIEFMNDRLIRQLGRNATGEYCYKALYDFETVCEWCVADQVFTGKSVRWELKNPKNARWCEVHNSPLRNGDGTISRQTIITDITEMKSTMEQLVHSQKMESIGQLAGGLAHDFNNMLSVINGYCCLMNMDVGQNKQLAEYVGKIQKATKRAGDLSHSLLAFSRTQVINPKNQNLNMIVFNVGTFIERIIGEDIHFRIVTNDAALLVHVDAGQIEQVLINLST